MEVYEARSAGEFPATRMPVPCTLRDGGWPGFGGKVFFYRRFGRPSNLSPDESVWLVFDRIIDQAWINLNDCYVGEVEGSGSFDVTARLDNHNRLFVVVETADDSGGIVGEV
ncbi:MAG TPA: hypothetical protein VKE40_00310, partial [Gemmataceae bacterium]|nr:hypothetical protein [Gemmataceae bacterium]